DKNCSVEVRLDKPDGTLVGTIPISYTGGWDKLKVASAALTNASGIHDSCK
ncbi:MAG: carbohydrate-binding protein, partial [Vallitaleaceae bacterium]|nr:carbohydrate-binding protein [Vallitaleaceae bacterium]